MIVIALILLVGAGYGAVKFISQTQAPKPTPSAAPAVTANERSQVADKPLGSTQLDVTVFSAENADIANLLVKALEVATDIALQGNLSAGGSATFAGNVTAGSFTGNGAGLTGVNATSLGGQSAAFYRQLSNLQGPLNDSQLSANVALRNANNAFSGANNFSGSNSFTGSTSLRGTTVTDLSASGNLTVGSAANLNGTTTITDLILTSPLAATSGGTGLTSVANQGILYGQGTAILGVTTPAGAGECLLSTATAVQWGSCSAAASGVTSLNGLNGAVSISNTTTGGSTITINDATTGAKGIASFNATNFSVTGGAVNTVQNITTTSTPTFAGLNLAAALNVSNGGTGATSLAADGVVIGHGTGALTAVTSGVPGECLVSTSGAPVFQTCPGSGNVISLNTLSGTLTLANTTSTGSVITINDAGPTTKGIASFSGTNFSTVGGAVNTIQDITTGSSPTFAAVNTGAITSTGTLTVGSTSQGLSLQGSNTTLSRTSGANTASLTFMAPTANVTYRLQTAATGTYDVCTTAGNCTGVGGGVSTPGGTNNALAKFTGTQTLGDSILSDNGSTVTVAGDLAVTGTLSLTSALTIANGGTGTNSLTSNGVLLGNGSGAITAVAAGGSGQCLVSTLGAPTWSACPGSGGVTTLNGLAGVLTLGNASGVGSTITIDDATTGSKGIASFNSGNFSVTAGAVNTIQNISTTASPTFAALNTNAITPSAAFTVGSTGQSTTLQGSNTTITATNGANLASLTFVAPTASVTYRLQTAAAGTYDVCTTAGNCTGVGGGVTTPGGTTNVLPRFTGSQTLGDSLVSDDGSLVTIGGNLSVTGTVSLANALTVGNGGTGATNATGARANLGAAASGANSDLTSLNGLTTALSIVQGGTGASSLTSNGVLLGNGTSAISSLVAGGAGQCLVSTAGAPIWQACPGGGGVASLNTLTGTLTIANASVAGSTITIDNATSGTKGIASFNAANFSVTAGAVNTIQDIDTLATPTFAGINTNTITPSGALTVGATSQNLTLQGANTTITATNGSSVASLTFVAPTANVTYRLQMAAAGTYDVCTTAGNCVGVGGGVTTAGGTTNTLPKFTGAQALGDSLLTDDGSLVTVGGDITVTGTLSLGTALGVSEGGTGATDASGARINLAAAASGANSDITSLSGLTTALSIVQGGTGAVSLTSNGVLLGNGTSAISSLAAGGSGLCLVSGVAAPSWQACPGGGGVSSLNSITGALTLANASAVGSTVTINDATTGAKGIASFNSTNFTVTGGAVNTIQNINTAASPTFTGVNTNTITPSSSFTAGATSQSFTLQGNASSTITATDSGNTTTLSFQAPIANATYRFLAPGAGTYDVCTTAGNCSGVGGGVTSPGGSTNKIPKFTAGQTIADSIITDNGTTVSIAGSLSVNTLTPTSGLTIGATSQSLTLQGNGSTSLTATSGGITNSLQFATPAASNKTITIPNASGTVAVSASGPISIDAAGNLTCATCVTSGGGGGGASAVDSLDGLTGTLTIANSSGLGSTITINDATTGAKGIASFNSTNFTATSGAVNTIQNINTTADPTFRNLSISTLSVSSSQATNPMIFANNTNAAGTGALIDLQLNGASRFSVTPAGNLTTAGTITSGLINGQTISAAANFTGSLAVGTSLTVTGAANLNGGATVTGTLAANTITPSSALTIGAIGQSLTLQGNGSTSLAATSGGITNSLVFAAPAASDKTITIPNATGTVAVSASGPLSLDANGNLTCASCVTSGGGGGGAGAVDSLNGLTGTLTIANASTSGSTITLDNAAAATKGIASFSATNFTVTSGAVNTVQNINTGASPTFAGVNTNSITPSAALTIGVAGQSYTLQGNASSSLTATNGANTTTVNFQTPTASVSYRFATAAAGTYDICTTVGNCSGAAGANTALSNLASVAINTALLPGNTTIDLGSNSAAFRDLYLGGTATNNFRFTGTATAARTLTMPDESGTLCTTASVCTGYAAASGASNYIQNQSASNQSADFRISGTGRANTSILTPLIDTPTAVALELGTATATAINLNQNVVVATNKNLTLASGTGLFVQNYANTTGTAATFNVTNTATAGATVLNAQTIALTGTNNAGGTNANNGLNFSNVAAATNNTYNAINVGTGFTDILRYSGTQLISGSGILQNAALSNGVNYSNLTQVGTLASGALGAGFTTVAVGQGGTGAPSFTANGILYGNGTGALGATAAGTNGQCLVANTGAAPSWSSCTGLITLQNAYSNGATISTTGNDIGFTLNSAQSFTVTTAAGATGSTAFALADGSNATPPAQLVLIRNNDTNQAVAAGIKVTAAVGGITTALDVSGANITNALAIGANAITGTNFSVTGAGAVTAVGLNAGSGLIQNTGGITTIGAIASINASSNFATNINTGSSNALVTIGGGSGTFALNTTNIDISAAGAITGATGISSSGTIVFSGLASGALFSNSGTVTSETNLAVARGGTGAGTFTANGLLYGNGTSAMGVTGAGTTGQCLIGNTGSAPTWSSCTGMVTLQNAYANGNTISTTGSDIAFTLNSAQSHTVATAAGATGSTTFSLTDGVNATPPAQLVLITNNDVNQALTSGLKVTSSAGAITNAIDASGTNITNAIAIGANAINGTNFSVTGGGAVTAVGVNSGTGLVQGTGGITVSGAAASINASSNFATNINTGSSNALVTIGGGSGTFALNTTNIDISAAGAITGATGVSSSGTIVFSGLASGALYSNGGTLTSETNLATTRGGTGAGNFTANGVLYGNGTGALSATAAGTNGQCLVANTGAAPSWTTCTGLVTLQNAYANGNSISTTGNDIAFTLNASQGHSVTTAAGATGFTTLSLADGGNPTAPAQLLLINNADTNQAMASGIKVTSAAGTITTAIDASGSNITNAIAIGANAISGTAFNVTGAGALTAVGVNAGTGLVQGTGGLTISGAAVSLNASSNNATNINTGSSNGLVTIGGGSGTFALNTTNIDISAAGAITGATGVSSSGTIAFSGLATNGAVYTSGGNGTLNSEANLAVSRGGTGAGSFTANNVLLGNGTGAFQVVAPGANGNVLMSNGTTWTSSSVGCGTCIAQIPTTTAQNTIAPTTASVVGLTVKGTTGTAANVLEIFNSSATPTRQAYFDSAGSLNVAQLIQPTSNNAIDLGISSAAFRTGYFGTSVLSAAHDTISAGAMTLGAANATSIGIGKTGSNIATTITGTAVIKPSSGNDSTTAFQVQNAAGSSLFNVNTSANIITLGSTTTAGNPALGTWQSSGNTLPSVLAYPSAAAVNGYVYMIGGFNGTTFQSNVYYAKILAGGNIGSWTTASEQLPAPRDNASTVTLNGYLYVFGGCNTAGCTGTVAENTVYYAKVNADGSTGAWGSTSTLPVGLEYSSAVTANGYVYLIGGTRTVSTYSDTVYYAKANADGTIGSWTTSPNVMAGGLSQVTSTVANGYIYTMGGFNTGVVSSVVSYAKLNTDGSIGTWGTTTSLPGLRHSGHSVTSNGYVYFIGGSDVGAGGQATVYYALPTSSGTLGSWTATSSMPGPARGGAAVVADGYVYMMGGHSGVINLNTVYYASTARIMVGTTLDLVGLSSQNYSDGGDQSAGSTGSSLIAGNTHVVGSLQVQNQATFAASVSVARDLTVGSDSAASPGTLEVRGNTRITGGGASGSGTTTTQNFNTATFPPVTAGTWSTGGTANWARTTTTSQEGAGAAASGTVTHNQTSWLDVNYTFTNSGSIKFYWNVSSEDTFDYLYFCLDNDLACDLANNIAEISGTPGWAEVTVPVSAGAHSIRWLYTKDNTQSAGTDKGWVDNVRFIEDGVSSPIALYVNDSKSTSTVALFENTSTGTSADGIEVRLGVANASRTASNYFVQFTDSTGTIAGKIQGGTNAVAYTTTSSDFAEYFRSDPLDKPQPGELVSLSHTDARTVVRSHQTPPLGIVSTNPGFIGNTPICNTSDAEECDRDHDKTNTIVALVGQVPTKVTVAGGAIGSGDPIASSDIPGVGRLAKPGESIVGYAEEAATVDGTIVVLVQPGYYNPTGEQADGVFKSLSINDQANTKDLNVSGEATVKDLIVTGRAILASLTVTGLAVFEGEVRIAGDVQIAGHLNSKTTTTPAATPGSAAGTGSTTVQIIGTDTTGTLKLHSGNNGTDDGTLAEVVFTKPYQTAPNVVLTASNGDAGSLRVYIEKTATGFKVISKDPLQPQIDYQFDYIVVGLNSS